MADIKIISKQNGVAVVLPTGSVFLGDPDGDYVAERGDLSTQVNIKRDIDSFYIVKNIDYTSIKDRNGNTIATSAEDCVSFLNNLFDSITKLASIDEVEYQNNLSYGQLLQYVSTPEGGRWSNETLSDEYTANMATADLSVDSARDHSISAPLLFTFDQFGAEFKIKKSLGADRFKADSYGVQINGLTYPTSDGANGEILTTNGAGTLSFTTLADVATSGAYSDLSGTPSIPTSGVDFDPVGTDNSTDVTLTGAYNYLTLAGQQITLGQVDYTTDISNTPTIPTSGVDFDPVGTDNSTDVTLSGPYNYLTLAGQQITLGQVDYTTDVSNTPTIPTSGVDFDPVGTDNSTDVTINANATDVLLLNPGQVIGSQDAGADKLVFWDDSAGKLTYADIGTNLTMTGTTLSASGGGGGGGGGGGSAGGNFMITGFTSSTTQQWYGLYLPYANSIRTSGNWQHYQIYHMPADGSFDNFSMHVQGNCQIEFGINVNPQTAPNDQADGTQYNYKQLSPTGSNHTSYYSPTNWTFSAGDEIGFGFRNVSGGAPFYVTFNVCFTFN